MANKYAEFRDLIIKHRIFRDSIEFSLHAKIKILQNDKLFSIN